MNFVWDSKYSLNIKSIDLQHQKFFEIINRIYLLLRQKPVERQDLVKVIEELNGYAEYHLGYEEDCFLTVKYPDRKSHQIAHNFFRKQIKKYYKKINDPHTDLNLLSEEMADFTKEWLSQHILNLDHEYASYLIRHDVK